MPVFYYKARDADGALIKGEVEAISADELKENLFSQGLVPVFVREVKRNSVMLDVFLRFLHRVKTEELVIFTRQFYTLFKAGVSMETILSTLSRQIASKPLRNAVMKIRSDVAAGASLSVAFGKHPHVFDELYVSMLAAGEEAGILDQVLEELARLLAKEEEIKKNVKSATLYPKIVVAVLVLAVVVLMTLVIPKFSSFYSRYGATLPLPTLILIGASNFVRNYWFVVLATVSGVYFAFLRYYNSRTGRLKIDTLRFSLPVFGELNLKISNARFGHILSALYKSGLPMPKCLDVTARVIGNEAFAKEVMQIRDYVQRGATLSEAMSRVKFFPPVVIETTSVGEKAGSLDEMLKTVADHYELEVNHTIKNLSTMIEPLLLIAIFGMVATLALAILLPIWNLSQVVNK